MTARILLVDDERPILDLIPESLHDRCPVYMGTREFVDEAERFLAADKQVEVTV